jgi:hypothetical protein
MKYIIQDWAGNTIQHNGVFNRGAYGRELGVPMEFDSFEAGWDYILGELADKWNLTEEDFQEYYVVEKE